jgi:dTMP kinase
VFITVEGIEGCGKSTLLAGLADRLRDARKEIFVTREPGGTLLGEAVREIFLDPGLAVSPLAEAMLMNAARAEHVEGAIRPALRRGQIVLCDRFTDSTLAYQGYGGGVDLAILEQLAAIATGGLMPDLTFVLDVPVTVSRARLRRRGQSDDRIEALGDDFHGRVRAGFLELARSSPRYRVIDGTKPPHEIVELALDAVRASVR